MVRRQAAGGGAAQAARNQQGKDDDRERRRRVAEEEHEVLNQRHLDQDVARSDAEEVEQKTQHALCRGRRVPRTIGGNARMMIVASMLMAISANKSGTALLIL